MSNVPELKLYYTAASAALKFRDISASERSTLVAGVLEAAVATFAFDQEAHVVTTLKLVVEKARGDGILDAYAATRLDQLLENAHTFADARFTNLVELLAKLETRVDQVETRVDRAEAYAQSIDESLEQFKGDYRAQLQRKAAVGVLKAVVAVCTLGLGTALVDVGSDMCDGMFDNIIDFTDSKDLIEAACGDLPKGSALAKRLVIFGSDNVGGWVEKPLEEALKGCHIPPNSVRAAAMVQMAFLLEADAAATFADLKASLDLAEDLTELPVDDDFWDAFEVVFDFSFADASPDAKDTCRRLIDARGQGKIKFLQWRKLLGAVARSGHTTMAEYLDSCCTQP